MKGGTHASLEIFDDAFFHLPCPRLPTAASPIQANEIHGEQFGIDIRDLIKLDDVTSRLGLGPNGGLVYCIEHLAENLDWLQEQMGLYVKLAMHNAHRSIHLPENAR